MTQSATAIPHCIGCDVGKKEIVIFDSRNGKSYSIANKPAELARFADSLDPTCLVICEATGGYEAGLLKALIAAGVPAHRADARKVKAFLRSYGTLAKTDKIDANGLARYGEERHGRLRRWQAPDHVRDRLQTLVLTRRDLVAARQAFANRGQAPGADAVKAPINAVMACLDKQIRTINAAIEALLKTDHALTQAAKTIQAIPGVGPVTAANLLALMPELGALSRRQAASLAGLAPHPRQSGQANGYRNTRGGRPEVKRTLFMAALVASRHNPQLKIFYDRLRANGKKPIVATTAVMRKLIVIVNAKLKNMHPAPQMS